MFGRSPAMSDTATSRDLLVVAVQDLHDAERAWVEKLPALADKASAGLSAFAGPELARSEEQAARLAQIAGDLDSPPDGAPNIWLRGILSDAERDAQTIVAGPLRDIALVGAFRKGKQSERVSYETAIGLANALHLPEASRSLTLSRDEEARADAELEQLLKALLNRPDSRSA
jgi:ferritin-like metal-binding protein YciE